MKTRTGFLGFLISAILVASPILASNTSSTESSLEKNFQQIKKNLLVGVNSNNLGLMVSSAYYLGEYKSNEAVIPLMKILKDGNSPSCARVMAALSLTKIGDARGLFAVKRAVIFDEDEHVKKCCKQFTNNR